MADFQGTTTVDSGADPLFQYLSDVSNLPRYFTRMTSAAPGDGEEVHTTAKMPDGHEVHGSAWFRTDPNAQTIAWGSEGPSAYHGSLTVTDDNGRAKVAVRLHTTRVEPDDPEIDGGIQETLTNIRQLFAK